MTTPEGKVKARVNKALKTLPRCWKFMPVQMGLGAPALDYLICVNGNFVAIETKAPGKKLSPRQEQTVNAICAARGAVYVIDGTDDDINRMMVFLSSLCK